MSLTELGFHRHERLPRLIRNDAKACLDEYANRGLILGKRPLEKGR